MKKKLLIFFIGRYLNAMAWIAPKRAGETGFMLFCRPIRRPVKPHHLEFLNTAEKFSVEYAGKKVQGYRWGKGPRKLLLLHGWESHSYWWKSVVTRLSKEAFTLISIDAPGHGLSEGDYINIPHYSGLIEQLIAREENVYAILAHSLGSFSTIYTTFRLPNLPISKIVVMASPGEVSSFVSYYKKVLGLSDRLLAAISDFFVVKIGHRPEYFSLKEFAKAQTLPGLIIHDTDDKEAPYQHALDAHKNWKNSQMVTTSGLGHNLKSQELIDRVKQFLD